MARDPRRVETGRRRKSIGAQRALGRRIKPESDVEETLIAIVDGLGKRLRGAHRLCRTVVLRLRFDDFERVTRSRSPASRPSRRRLSSPSHEGCSTRRGR